MRLPIEVNVENEYETAETANRFAASINRGDVVALLGNLGSGKTFFAKKLCENFGIFSAGSPSFAIVNQYKNEVTINHFDFYRIKKEEELFDIGFNEYITDDGAITLIEWADMFPDILPRKYFRVVFEITGNTKRKITINKNE